LFRFDLFLDANFNLFVFEINQSPNIHASEKYKNNQNVYENVLYNLFNLIGVGTSYETDNLRFKSIDDESMVVHRNSLKVKPEICMDFPCDHMYAPQCDLCWNFLNQDRRYDLQVAYLEQMHSGEMKRLFPPKKDFMDDTDSSFLDEVQLESQLHVRWFVEMCKKDEKFC
jgi:tubulin monoglycylase TTLL15